MPQLNFPPRFYIPPTDQILIILVDPRDGERESGGVQSNPWLGLFANDLEDKLFVVGVYSDWPPNQARDSSLFNLVARPW